MPRELAKTCKVLFGRQEQDFLEQGREDIKCKVIESMAGQAYVANI